MIKCMWRRCWTNDYRWKLFSGWLLFIPKGDNFVPRGSNRRTQRQDVRVTSEGKEEWTLPQRLERTTGRRVDVTTMHFLPSNVNSTSNLSKTVSFVSLCQSICRHSTLHQSFLCFLSDIPLSNPRTRWNVRTFSTFYITGCVKMKCPTGNTGKDWSRVEWRQSDQLHQKDRRWNRLNEKASCHNIDSSPCGKKERLKKFRNVERSAVEKKEEVRGKTMKDGARRRKACLKLKQMSTKGSRMRPSRINDIVTRRHETPWKENGHGREETDEDDPRVTITTWNLLAP